MCLDRCVLEKSKSETEVTGQISAGAMAELHMNSTCVTSHWSHMVSTWEGQLLVYPR